MVIYLETCRTMVTLIRIREGKTIELSLRDFREVNIRSYNFELSKLKNRTEQNCQRANEQNNQTTLQKK